MRKESKLWIVLDNPEQKGGIEAVSEDIISALKGDFKRIRIIYLHADRCNLSKGTIAFKRTWPFFLKKVLMFLYIDKNDYLIFHQPGHLKYFLRDTNKTILFVHSPSEISKFKELKILHKIKIACVADHIIRHLNCFPQHKIRIIPPIPKCESIIAKSKNGYKFLYLGRFSSEKNLEKTINILKDIALENKNVAIYLDLIGEGKEKENLKVLIKNLKITNLSISMKPWISRDQLCSLFSSYAFYISTSETEGMPIAVREAMSAGLIPIVSDIPAHNEIITHLYNGFILNEKFNYTLFLDNTINRTIRNQMSENARSTVTNHGFENFKYSLKEIFKN